jgi:hypothetical protein
MIELIYSEKLKNLISNIDDFQFDVGPDYISHSTDDNRFTIIRETFELSNKAFENNCNIYIYYTKIDDFGIYVIAKDETDLENKVNSWSNND